MLASGASSPGDTSRALRGLPGLWSLFRDVCKSDSPTHLNVSSDVCQFCLNATGRERKSTVMLPEEASYRVYTVCFNCILNISLENDWEGKNRRKDLDEKNGLCKCELSKLTQLENCKLKTDGNMFLTHQLYRNRRA